MNEWIPKYVAEKLRKQNHTHLTTIVTHINTAHQITGMILLPLFKFLCMHGASWAIQIIGLGSIIIANFPVLVSYTLLTLSCVVNYRHPLWPAKNICP